MLLLETECYLNRLLPDFPPPNCVWIRLLVYIYQAFTTQCVLVGESFFKRLKGQGDGVKKPLCGHSPPVMALCRCTAAAFDAKETHKLMTCICLQLLFCWVFVYRALCKYQKTAQSHTVVSTDNKLVLQIEDKDVPILSHLVDIRVVNLRDEEDVSTSNKDGDDDDEEEESPKVQALLDVSHVFLYVDTVFSFICTQAAVTYYVSAALSGTTGALRTVQKFRQKQYPCRCSCVLSQAKLTQLLRSRRCSLAAVPTSAVRCFFS